MFLRRLRSLRGLMLLCGPWLVLTVSGCGSLEPRATGLWPGSWFNVESAEKTDRSTAQQKTDPDPFALHSDSDVQTISESTLLQSRRDADSPFDETTMMLIEAEFRDLSAKERREWFEELRKVSPEMIPHVIRMRRLALEHAKKNGQQTEQQAVAQTPAYQSGGPHDYQPQPSRVLEYPEPGPGVGSTTDGNPTDQIQPASATELQADVTNTAQSLPSTKSAETPQRQEVLQKLISRYEKQITFAAGEEPQLSQQQLTDHVALRMLYLMADRQERSLEAIPGLSTAEQEYWQKLFWAISNSLDDQTLPDPADRATQTVSQLSEAADRLRNQANLEIRNASFSKGIQGFGHYDRFDKDEFRPGQPVLIYAEMRNFHSELTSNGYHKTVLNSTIEIHRAGNNPGLIISEDMGTTEDLCRSRRHDYFHSYITKIPEDLTIGPYVLKLIVEDQLSNKVATYTLNFLVK